MCGCAKQTKVTLSEEAAAVIQTTSIQKTPVKTLEEIRRAREEYRKKERKIANEHLKKAVIIKKANRNETTEKTHSQI